VKKAMAIVLFLVVLAFIVRAPGQTLGEGIGTAVGNAGHFISRTVTPHEASVSRETP
jgi:hypothetical protein